MRPSRSRVLTAAALLLVPAALGACGEAAPAPAVPAATVRPAPSAAPAATVAEAAPAAPMPELRTGPIAPIERREVAAASVLARAEVGDWETLALAVPRPAPASEDRWRWRRDAIEVEIDGGGPYAFVGDTDPTSVDRRAGPEGALVVWVRRPRASAGKALEGHIRTPADGAAPGHHLRFRLEAAVRPPAGDPAVEARWADALAEELAARSSSPFHHFAQRRVRERFEPKKTGKPGLPGATPAGRQPRGDLAELMGTTTGATSIQEALQADRGLILASTQQRPSVPLARVEGVGLAEHPWAEMLRASTSRAAPPAEPLAAAVPAEFYFVRARGLLPLLDVLDRTDTLGTPAASVLQRRGERRDVAPRYEAELGLGRGPLTRALGPEVVEDLAVVGSDPYVHEGTDVTFLFRLKPGKKGLFDAAVAAALAAHGAAHGSVAFTKVKIQGAEVSVARSPDGAIRQHRASVGAGDIELVSNSPGALARILEALQKKRPALSGELDFQYMLTRDAARAGAAAPRDDILVFFGDRFVSEVVGPRQKILEARRQIALAELQTPGFAALLHGLLTGKSPASRDDLIKSGLLRKEELTHAGGGAIAWEPGKAARSAWGTPAAMTPLIDLPEPSAVTEAEASAYRRFAETYRSYWSRYIDPVAIRVGTSGQGGALSADVRVLPILDGSDYRDLMREVGRARVEADPIPSGARAVLAIGQDADIRRELGSMLSDVVGRDRLKLDWLGEWAMVGVADEPGLARAALGEGDVPQRPATEAERERRMDDFEMLAGLPVYAAIAVKNQAGAAIALVAARKLAEEAIPGMFTWGEVESRRGVSIVRVAVRDDDRSDRMVTVYYALAHGALYVALQERTIQRLVDDALDGRGPRAPAVGAAGAASPAQLVIDEASPAGAPLSTTLGWLLEGELVDNASQARAIADVLLRGAPESAAQPGSYEALGRAYLGYVPVTPAGKLYAPAPDGARDPDRGTPHAPVYPALPVKGSPVELLLAQLTRFRAELAFDDEPTPKGTDRLQSLHVRVSMGGQP